VNSTDPLFWLGISLSLLILSLVAVLFAALPTLLELARVARSAEKLIDTLTRELPPILETLRLTGAELGELSEDIKGGVKSATNIVQQVDESIVNAKEQVFNVQVGTRSALKGITTAWRTFFQPSTKSNLDNIGK
jgi:predicted PurR-regulated permease PerM